MRCKSFFTINSLTCKKASSLDYIFPFIPQIDKYLYVCPQAIKINGAFYLFYYHLLLIYFLVF